MLGAHASPRARFATSVLEAMVGTRGRVRSQQQEREATKLRLN
jgi:hypothetical protein